MSSLTSTASNQNASLSMDLRSLDSLRASAAKGGKDQAGIKEAAKQLESLFMGELLKSMRATTMSTGMLDNQATEMGNNMLDQQLSAKMSGLPGGLGDMILKQLERQVGKVASGDKAADGTGLNLPSGRLGGLTGALDIKGLAAPARTSMPGTEVDDKKLSPSERFVRKHTEAAEAAEKATGIPSEHILGQAALESGWGRKEPKMADGTSSHNLFGIKATSSWTGKVAEVTTTEYIGGVARKVTAKFRAYDSYEDSFKDHARLLSQSPRYAQTVAQADTAKGFAQGLQKAGYATDPAYADKLTKVINTTLRLQRSFT
ncbi:flagellar assembly peptidoglycan hydrolase FlgJ [Aquabacterium soli]|uniref:Peptidoglycan hydrolase FlgJ n=1 Tax=Aquabacterium soli TaxID=2493092 RepID=A0A426VGT5_9BURK|nr:flagellar assembly peptidoglycan hydrolase FlgJ [Aquabacterium soli]RRS05951.1 flagellar assembly peptidoglycan hydrolase FlgJ [Aquabacterium soli]